MKERRKNSKIRLYTEPNTTELKCMHICLLAFLLVFPFKIWTEKNVCKYRAVKKGRRKKTETQKCKVISVYANWNWRVNIIIWRVSFCNSLFRRQRIHSLCICLYSVNVVCVFFRFFDFILLLIFYFLFLVCFCASWVHTIHWFYFLKFFSKRFIFKLLCSNWLKLCFFAFFQRWIKW